MTSFPRCSSLDTTAGWTLRRSFSRLAGWLLVTGCLWPALLLADDYPKNHDLDVVHYRFELKLLPQERKIEGLATVSVDVLASDVEFIQFDLHNDESTTATGEQQEGMTVDAVHINGSPAAYSHRKHRLRIPFDDELRQALLQDPRLQVDIQYRGIPANGLGAGPNKYGTWSWFSDNWPNKARHWLPTVDHPYDKATSEMVITAPSGKQVISNGLLVEERDLGNGFRLTHWKQSVPVATWLYTLGVTEFAVQHLPPFRGAPVQTWVFAQDRDAGFYDFAEPTHHVMEFYSDHVGPYAYEKLANVQSARTKGGMEAASAIMYDDRSVTGERSKRWRNVVIHEIAHQWFGNAVTEADWDDVWLSEGFATYFTLLFIEHAYGRDEFVDGLRSSRDAIFGFYDKDPAHRIVHDNLTDMSKVTTGNTYQKGAWTLHMLRTLVGDEAFWRGIRDYYRRYQNQNASTPDFRRILEHHSGLELEGFFDQWLRRPGLPEIEWRYTYDADRKRLLVDIDQIQQEPPFVLRLPIEVSAGEGSSGSTEVHVVSLDQRSHHFEFEFVAPPDSVLLDPETEVLHRARLMNP